MIIDALVVCYDHAELTSSRLSFNDMNTESETGRHDYLR